jgi:hypothetical protein
MTDWIKLEDQEPPTDTPLYIAYNSKYEKHPTVFGPVYCSLPYGETKLVPTFCTGRFEGRVLKNVSHWMLVPLAPIHPDLEGLK